MDISKELGSMVKILLDKKSYSSKPSTSVFEGEDYYGNKLNQVVAINYRIAKSPADVSISELAQAVENGQTFCPSVFREPRRKDELFLSSQLFCLDLDKGLIEFKQKPSILYRSFSFTEECPKYRAIWLLDRPVEDLDEYKSRLLTWMNAHEGCDQVTKDSARLYYGSFPGSVEFISESVLKVESIKQAVQRTKPITKDYVLDDGSEATQKSILLKLKAKHPRRHKHLVSKLKQTLTELKIANEHMNTSRYELLWNATARFALEEELIPSVVAKWIIDAAESNRYFSENWDKDIVSTVENALQWSLQKRDK